MNQKLYDIECLISKDKWTKMIGFQYMQKSYAEGAWAMLKSFYNHHFEYRLLENGVVVAEMGKQTIKVN